MVLLVVLYRCILYSSKFIQIYSFLVNDIDSFTLGIISLVTRCSLEISFAFIVLPKIEFSNPIRFL